MTRSRWPVFALVALLATIPILQACADPAAPERPRATADATNSGQIPIPALGAAGYFGLDGQLYPGSDVEPAVHDSLGRLAAQSIVLRDVAGVPAATGRIVLLCVGFSNTTQSCCAKATTDGITCDAWTFMGQAQADPAVRKPGHGFRTLDGAKAQQTWSTWDQATDANYARIATMLSARSASEQQVQAVWLEAATSQPTVSLPAEGADAYQLVRAFGDILRALHTRYPHLAQVFISPREYGGYATNAINPEPYAYENGFAAKWVIAAQIHQQETGEVDSLAGDLAGVPFVDWGPYLWANGTQPNPIGLAYVRADFEADGLHPSKSGETKIGGAVLHFFKTSPYTSCWFLVMGGPC